MEYMIMPVLVVATSKRAVTPPAGEHTHDEPMIVANNVPVPTSSSVGQMRSPTTWATGRFWAKESPNFRRTVSFQ